MARPVIRRFRLKAHPGYHVRVVVWATNRELENYYGHGNALPGKDVGGFFRNTFYNEATRVFDNCRVGDLHLSREHWTLEIVFHECLHAAFSLREATMGPLTIQDVPVALDEPVCYSIGKLADDVYKWMWELAPNQKWVKAEVVE